jgi:hypothetical protein
MTVPPQQDPGGEEPPHDVLAAEEFALPTAEQANGGPAARERAHDVLAAEEFALPTPEADDASRRVPGGRRVKVLTAVAVAIALAAVVRRRAR